MKNSKYRVRNSQPIQKIDRLFKQEKVWCYKDTNEFCSDCRIKVKQKRLLYFGPTLPLYIGSRWNRANLKILFVGKVIEKNTVSKQSCFIKNKEQAYEWIFDLDKEKEKGLKLPFIKYIIGTLQYLIDEGILRTNESGNMNIEIMDYLAMSNLVKCGAGNIRIHVGYVQKNFAVNCFDEDKLNLFAKELKIIKPDVVIFLTSYFYLSEIEKRYFPKSTRQEKKSKVLDGYYWFHKHNNSLFICSWHPGRKTREYIDESRKVFADKIKKYIM